jgi:hypothetical protein
MDAFKSREAEPDERLAHELKAEPLADKLGLDPAQFESGDQSPIFDEEHEFDNPLRHTGSNGNGLPPDDEAMMAQMAALEEGFGSHLVLGQNTKRDVFDANAVFHSIAWLEDELQHARGCPSHSGLIKPP